MSAKSKRRKRVIKRKVKRAAKNVVRAVVVAGALANVYDTFGGSTSIRARHRGRPELWPEGSGRIDYGTYAPYDPSTFGTVGGNIQPMTPVRIQALGDAVQQMTVRAQNRPLRLQNTVPPPAIPGFAAPAA